MNGGHPRRRNPRSAYPLAHLERIPPPPPKLSLSTKMTRYISHFQSPLELRYSIVVLRKPCKCPCPQLLQLFCRIPWRFQCAPPPPPREILVYPEQAYMDTHTTRISLSYAWPPYGSGATPQRPSRLNGASCTADDLCISYEAEYLRKIRAQVAAAPACRTPTLSFPC